MAHRPDTELKALLATIEQEMPKGTRYAHYKHPELSYRIDGFCILETTDDVGILYTAEYGAGVTYCRALIAFIEHVTHEGKLVPRFTRLP